MCIIISILPPEKCTKLETSIEICLIINIALKRGVAEHGESCAHKKRENKSKKRRHA